jgi:hypothetical protein
MKDILSEKTFSDIKQKAYQVTIKECHEKETTGFVKLPKPKQPDRIFDKDDIASTNALIHRGERDCPQIFYVNLLKEPSFMTKSYTYNETKTQVSRLRYRPEDNTWLGYQLKDHKVTVLEEEWVMKLPEKVRRRALEEAEKGNRKFIPMPVGDIIEVIPTMDISRNPIVQFQQKDLDTCAFSSLASALFYLGYVEQAVLLHAYGEEWTLRNEELTERTLEAIVKFIPTTKKFKYFRKHYKPHRLNQNYDIFEKVPANEIRLIVIIMSDNTESHAVTVVNDYIFDANCTNALPLTLEGFDCCCGVDATFVGVSKGYHWRPDRK